MFGWQSPPTSQELLSKGTTAVRCTKRARPRKNATGWQAQFSSDSEHFADIDRYDPNIQFSLGVAYGYILKA
jgi:hypothetical protein